MNSVLFSLRLSLQVGIVATILVGISGTFLAYVFSRKNFFAKEILDVLLTLPLVLPPTVTGYYLVVLLGRRGFFGKYLYELTGWSIIFTWQAAVVASAVVSFPLMFRTARAAIESVDPNFLKASYTLGKSELVTALRIVLHLARRGIIAGLVISFGRALGEFGATLMLAGNIPGKTNTMPLSIYAAVNSGDRGEANILVLVLTFVPFGLLYLANRLERSSDKSYS